jgi:hypothetical protein
VEEARSECEEAALENATSLGLFAGLSLPRCGGVWVMSWDYLQKCAYAPWHMAQKKKTGFSQKPVFSSFLLRALWKCCDGSRPVSQQHRGCQVAK